MSGTMSKAVSIDIHGVNLSYGAGASTSLDVLDAQRRARDADTAVATAEDAARQARLDYLLGSGSFP